MCKQYINIFSLGFKNTWLKKPFSVNNKTMIYYIRNYKSRYYKKYG